MMSREESAHHQRSLSRESGAQTADLAPVQHSMLHVLNEQATALARSTGVMVRQRQLSGASFASLLILGWLQDPDASLEAWVQFGSRLNVQIRAQGLDQRFTFPAVVFLKALFEVALTQLVQADPVALPLLSRFSAVDLEDSRSHGLPDELAGLFQGCGGSSPEAGLSACKLHLRYDACRGGLQLSSLQDGRAADCATPLAQVPAAAGSLEIRDRGFFALSRISSAREQGCSHLPYLKGGTGIRDQEHQPLDLLVLLHEHSGPLDREVLVGENRLPMRLLAVPVPPEVLQERRQHLMRAAQKHGRAANHEQLRLVCLAAFPHRCPCHLALVARSPASLALALAD